MRNAPTGEWPARGESVVKETQLTQRTMIRVAHDDVVQHFDLEKLARADEVAGHFDVGFRWGRVAGRVIMHEHHRGSVADDRRAEHLAWVHENCVQRTDG